jgi:NAD kinase
MFGLFKNPSEIGEIMELVQNPNLVKKHYNLQNFLPTVAKLMQQEFPLQDGEQTAAIIIDRDQTNGEVYITASTFGSDGTLLRVLQRWTASELMEAIDVGNAFGHLEAITTGKVQTWQELKAILKGQLKLEKED